MYPFFFSLDTSLTTMLKMIDFLTSMPTLEPLRLPRFLIEKKLHGTTSQLLLQKMVNFFILCTIGKMSLKHEDRLRFSPDQGFHDFYFFMHLAECTECFRHNYSLSDVISKSYIFSFTVISA